MSDNEAAGTDNVEPIFNSKRQGHALRVAFTTAGAELIEWLMRSNPECSAEVVIDYAVALQSHVRRVYDEGGNVYAADPIEEDIKLPPTASMEDIYQQWQKIRSPFCINDNYPKDERNKHHITPEDILPEAGQSVILMLPERTLSELRMISQKRRDPSLPATIEFCMAYNALCHAHQDQPHRKIVIDELHRSYPLHINSKG